MSCRQAQAVSRVDRHRSAALTGLPGSLDRLVVERSRGASADSAVATAAWVAGRSASVLVDPNPFLAPASSMKSSRAPRALPSAAAAIDAAKKPNTGKRYNGRSTIGPSNNENTRSVGTKTSSATVSWLPVPRRPSVCHVSRTRRSCLRSATTDGTRWSSTRHPANIMSACVIPLQNGQRPDTTTPPSTVRPVPRGAHTPAATPRPSPKSASRLEVGRYATSRLLVIAIETHQPAEALPRATASAHPSATPGGNSSPRTSVGAPARNSPDSPRRATNASGSRLWSSISSDISRASTAICSALASMSFEVLGVCNSGWFIAISAFMSWRRSVQSRYQCQFSS